MKSIKCLSLFVMFLIGALSCERHSLVDEPETATYQVNQIKATYSDPEIGEATKTEVDKFYYSIVWRTGDEIAVVNVTKNRIDRFVYSGEDRGKTQVFDAAATYTYDAGDDIFAVYPYSAVSFDGAKVKVSLADGLTYTNTQNNEAFRRNDIQVSDKLDPASIAESNNAITLNRQVTLLSLYSMLSGSEFTSRTLSSVTIGATSLSGTAEVKFNDAGPYLVPDAGVNAMTVAIASGVKLGNPTTPAVNFIPLYPFSFSGGFSLEFTTTDGMTVGAYRKAAASLVKNVYYDFTFFETGYTRVNSKEHATVDRTWWVESSNGDLAQDSTAGAYTNSSLPGSGAGSYGDGAPLSDE